MLIYDDEGNLTNLNRSALKIINVHDKKDIPVNNLFNNPIFHFKKESLIKKGLFKFQLNPKNIANYTNFEKSQNFLIDGVVSVIDSGFLVQVNLTSPDSKSEKLIFDEKKYRRFFEDDLTGDFIATPEGKIVECNPAFAEIYGFKNLEDASNADMSTFNLEDWKIIIKRLETEYKIKNHQTTHMRHDGKQIHIVSNIVAVFSDNTGLDHVKGFIFDDTERKNAEKALKESEKKYHLLFDEDLTGDFIATPEGKILECNPAFAEIYGLENCENAQKWNISESNPFDWPYMVTKIKNEGKLLGFQSWQRRSDAQRIHVVANLVGIFNDLGELTQVKGYVFDDSERKKTEEKLNRDKLQMTDILDSIQDGFVVINNFWHLTYVNRCAAEYLGKDADDLVGQNILEIFPKLHRTVYEKKIKIAMNNQEIQQFEATGIKKSDQIFHISVYPWDEGLSVHWRHNPSKL
ncbi:MAG: PAS domain S-box protein [Methanobacterium sp.]|nr:PAS domain S-box protein [Methanobacterium sp.]